MRPLYSLRASTRIVTRLAKILLLRWSPFAGRFPVKSRMCSCSSESITLRAATLRGGPSRPSPKRRPGTRAFELVTEPLSYHDVLSFYASGDVFVSLHRAEGLGLGIMEAMALGKPVIATGWSGNMGFMDYRTACPVRYRLGPAHGEHSFLKPEFLGPHALWARPLIEDAVAWMRKLHTSPDLRKRIGAAAKARIESYQEEAWGRAWVDEFAALWQTRAFLPALPGKYSSPSIQIGVGNRGKITALRSPDVER